jgi:oligopeptide transport system substrate-binding protein
VRGEGAARVVVSLNHPFPALPELMAHPAMTALPLHRATWISDRPMTSSGAYQLTRWALADHIELRANPAWHGGVPANARVDWRPITDTLAALRLFEAGGADVLGDIPSARLASVKAKLGPAVHIAPYRGAYYFAFNTRKPPFNDVRVRQALSLATERDWIAKRLIATGIAPAWGVVPPGTTGLADYRPAWRGWPREKRLAQARALLAAAGYGPQRPLQFDIRFNSDIDHRRISVALAAFWKPLGVKARLLNSESSLHFASLRRADFALARSGWIGDLSVPENFLAVHRSDGGPINYSGFADPAYDAALDRALAIADPVRRAHAMRAAEVRLIDQMPILPIYYYVSKSLVAPRVTGWRDNSANVHPSRTLGLAAR